MQRRFVLYPVFLVGFPSHHKTLELPHWNDINKIVEAQLFKTAQGLPAPEAPTEAGRVRPEAAPKEGPTARLEGTRDCPLMPFNAL